MIHNDHGPETRLENKNNNNFNSPVQSDNNALSSAYNATTAEIATKNKNHNKSNLNKSDAIGTATPSPPPIVPPPGRPNNSITKQGREADSNTNNTNSETCISSSKLDIENQIYTATFYDKSTTNKSKQQPKTCSVVHQPARTLSKKF